MTPRALTIAGSDPGGGAGIQQDLKTFQALGAWGMTAITAITVQDTTGVTSWARLEPGLIVAQIAACARDIGVDAAKTGMLADAEVVAAVARAVAGEGIELLVVDPVLVATSGDALASDDVVKAFREELIPRATLVTPNAAEAAALTGAVVASREGQEDAARALVAMGARAALVTGGDLQGEDAIDVLAMDDGTVEILTKSKMPGGPFHGTGCMLSAAIAAHLARGAQVRQAAGLATRFVHAAIAGARPLGRGAVPVDPARVEDA